MPLLTSARVIGFVAILLAAADVFGAPPTRGSRIRGPMILNQPAVIINWTVPNLCAAYNFPTKLTGGSVIGIAEFGGGYTKSDLTLFSNTYMNGTPINISDISVDGTVNSPGVDPGTDAEVALDIQIAAAAYYYCTGKAPTIKVIFATPLGSNDQFVINNANIITAASNAGCDVLSISYGTPENSIVNVNNALTLESAAVSATSKGMAIFASSGDGNATNERQGETDGKNHLILPSSCPHIIAVGGTTKTLTSEVVWNNGFSLGTPYPLGTGGGYSTIFPVQSFQIGAPVAPTTNNGRGRMVPDVSANADPNTPYFIAFQGSIQAAGNGTSASSPLWAGLVASFGKKLGFITPTLWLTKNRSAFVDIVSGNNGLFTAAGGPDACTGLGAPNGKALSSIFFVNPLPTPPNNPSNVLATYDGPTKKLTLMGDVNPNSLTVSLQAGVLTVQGANGTKINNSVSFTTPFSGSLVLSADLKEGNDAISFVGIPSSSMNVILGSGNDQAAFTLCNITSLTINGDSNQGNTGVDTLLTTSSTIGALIKSNIP